MFSGAESRLPDVDMAKKPPKLQLMEFFETHSKSNSLPVDYKTAVGYYAQHFAGIDLR